MISMFIRALFLYLLFEALGGLQTVLKFSGIS